MIVLRKTLSLWGTGLSGSIPNEVGRMTSLSSLVLSQTKVSGVMPPSMKLMWNLTYLEVLATKTTGTVTQLNW
jgi:hypothetical protein